MSTNETKQAYTCPKCGSDDVEQTGDNWNTGTTKQFLNCSSCGADWTQFSNEETIPFSIEYDGKEYDIEPDAETRLKNAAPDLLEALTQLYYAHSKDEADYPDKRLFNIVMDAKEKARAAIAKAKGEN